jgi:hypothetical protein
MTSFKIQPALDEQLKDRNGPRLHSLVKYGIHGCAYVEEMSSNVEMSVFDCYAAADVDNPFIRYKDVNQSDDANQIATRTRCLDWTSRIVA